MNDFDIPRSFESLGRRGLDQEIYNAINKEDLSDVSIAALDTLRKADMIPQARKHAKSEAVSVSHRKIGNKAYADGEYKTALEYYNKALLYAPMNSEALSLAYSNRSALFFKLDVYSACIEDINTCLSLSCPNEILNKLRDRKRECLKHHLASEKMINSLYESVFGNTFFDFKVKTHPQIRCASRDVKISFESDTHKVIAATDIKVGTVVALETPFVSVVHYENLYFSCYYCHNQPLNLMPCNGCCFALFCSETCKRKCMNEYHEIECQIMEMLYEFYEESGRHRLMVKAALKMRQKCKSWAELVSASNNIGSDRMKSSSVEEIYNADSKFSLLCHNRESHFVDGRMFNVGISCAIIVYYLDKLPHFLPQSVNEKDAAIRALTRIMTHLYLSMPMVNIDNAAQNVMNNQLTSDTTPDFGWFSFTNKLKHECDANLLVLGVNNRVALIALHPIERGDELKISYLGHWYEHINMNDDLNFRTYALYNAAKMICYCKVCEGMWSSMNLYEGIFSEEHRKCYQRVINMIAVSDKIKYIETSRALSTFYGTETTVEHHRLFKEFRTNLMLFQYLATKNKIILQNPDYIKRRDV